MMKRFLLTSCAVGALAIVPTMAIAASPIDTSPAVTSPAEGVNGAADGGTQDIVVTAEKRAQSLQSVPVAITAFSAAQRDLKGITTIQDITNFTPGLTYSTQLDRISIRGLGRLTNTLAADSAVAVYSDDFYTTTSTEAGRSTLFVDRVEVLRGPQGTLYGRNAIAGVINVISKRPTSELYAEARATYGNYDYVEAEGAISGPLADGLRVRLAGSYLDQSKGYFTNIYGGLPTEGGARKEYYVEGQVAADIGENAEFWVKGFDQHWNDRGGPGGLVATPTVGRYDVTLMAPSSTATFNPDFGYAPSVVVPCGAPAAGRVCGTGPVAGTVVGAVNGGINPADQHIRNFAHDQALDVRQTESYSFNAHFTYHFPTVDLKYVGGYTNYHYHLTSDWDNSSVSSYQVALDPAGSCGSGAFGPACTNLTVNPGGAIVYDEYNHWMSHELNLSSTSDGPLQWVVGAYYFDEGYHNPIAVNFKQPQIKTPISAGLSAFGGAPNPSDNFFSTDYRMKTTSYAGYGQVDWKVTDTVKLTGGLRYTLDHKRGTESYRLVGFESLYASGLTAEGFGSFLPALDLTPVAISSRGLADNGTCSLPTQGTDGRYTRCLDDKSSATTGTAGAEWTPDRETLIYGRYSRGYKAFGFNAGAISPQPETKKEELNAFEVGIKKSFGNRITVNVASYYYDYINAQVPVSVNTGGVIQNQFFNVSSSYAAGLEFEGQWSPTRGLNFSLTYGFNATGIRSDCKATGNVGATTPPNCFPDQLDPLALAPGAQGRATNSGGQVLQSVKGNPLPQAPRNKAAFNTNYTFPVGSGDLTLSGSYIWKDKSYSGVFDRRYNEAPAWGQADFRIVWASKGDKLELIGFLKNAFDTLGYEAATNGIATGQSTLANSTYALTAPRLFGIEARVKF